MASLDKNINTSATVLYLNKIRQCDFLQCSIVDIVQSRFVLEKRGETATLRFWQQVVNRRNLLGRTAFPRVCCAGQRKAEVVGVPIAF